MRLFWDPRDFPVVQLEKNMLGYNQHYGTGALPHTHMEWVKRQNLPLVQMLSYLQGWTRERIANAVQVTL